MKSCTYSAKLEKLEEIGKFLETFHLQILTKEEVDSQKSPITSKNIEIVIKNLPHNKSSGPDRFMSEFLSNIQKTTINLNFCQNIKEMGTPTYTFSEEEKSEIVSKIKKHFIIKLLWGVT